MQFSTIFPFLFHFRFHNELMEIGLNEIRIERRFNGKLIYTYSIDKVLRQLQDPSFKGTAVFNDIALKMYNYKKDPKDRLYFNQLEEKIMSDNVHVSLSDRSNFLYSTFDWKIKQLVEGGFFVHWMDRYTSHPSVQKSEPGDSRIVLTMEHLSVGFTMWLGILRLASFALIGELAWFQRKNYLRGILFKMISWKYQKLRCN